ncbi:hypothetical protein [Halegenticoccus soli]|uniref:hypothetical protein n=1 Tax=Halegenticoccus soli TaxID=1985678 RepID=UPI000C6E686F|nr:hypothetical protein [Halegenticoccus soli]
MNRTLIALAVVAVVAGLFVAAPTVAQDDSDGETRIVQHQESSQHADAESTQRVHVETHGTVEETHSTRVETSSDGHTSVVTTNGSGEGATCQSSVTRSAQHTTHDGNGSVTVVSETDRTTGQCGELTEEGGMDLSDAMDEQFFSGLRVVEHEREN